MEWPACSRHTGNSQSRSRDRLQKSNKCCCKRGVRATFDRISACGVRRAARSKHINAMQATCLASMMANLPVIYFGSRFADRLTSLLNVKNGII